MNKKLMVTLPLLSLLILLMFSGCVKKSVSEDQLKNDLIKHEGVQTCFSSEFTKESTYTINSFEITKEQINNEDKQDLIYCNLTIKNDYFNVELSVKCTYNFYDKGGWILDEFNILEMNVTPISAADGQELINKILDVSSDKDYKNRTAINCFHNDTYKTLRHGTLSIIDCTFDNERMQTNVVVCYKSDVIEVNGHYILYFDKNDGWKIKYEENTDENKKLVMSVDNYDADYSCAIGNFTSNKVGNMNIVGYNLNVVEISNNLISYSLKIDGYESYTYLDSATLIDDFDPLTGTVMLRTGKYSMYGNELDSPAGTYIYNPIDDRWDSSYGPDYPNSYSSNQFFMPRQLGRQ